MHNGSNVYGLMLDASKAFDHYNYCKLFRMLLKKMCPFFCRLLLNMYLNKTKHRIQWDTTHSPYCIVINRVKQGGVISPILFCITMWGALWVHLGMQMTGRYSITPILKHVSCYMWEIYQKGMMCCFIVRKVYLLFTNVKDLDLQTLV